MSLKKVTTYRSDEEEIATLLKVLRDTGQRLEALTAGEVDTAADPDGRVLLLRGTSAQMEHNEMARQAAILNALPANIALLAPDGTIISVNDGWRTFADSATAHGEQGRGLGANYLRVCDRATRAGSHDARLAADGIRSVLDGSTKGFSLEYEGNSPTEEAWFRLSVTPLSSSHTTGVIVMHADISASKRDRSSLLLIADRLSLATQVAKVGVWEWDIASDVLIWDAMLFTIYGIPQIDPMSYERWSSAVHPEDLPGVEAKLQRAINQRTEEWAEFRIIAGDGTIRYVSAAERAVVDQSGAVSRVIGVNVDITHRKMADEALRHHQSTMKHLAEHDILTELPNQRVLRERIEQAITVAAREMNKVAILFLDLNGFKYVNDALGHPFGDRLLQSVAENLVQCVRTSDTVSRFGGDEFVLLLPDVHGLDAIAATAERTLNAVAAIQSVDELELQVTACVGISVYPDDGLDGDALIKNADAAMHHAKGKGGAGYQFFHADMSTRAMERQFIEQNLRRALDRHELALHYQPKFDLKSRAITGVEALLRWNHSVRGPISPATFIPVAEECGLILPIGMWVLEEACRQARVWLDAGLPKIGMAVNVSGRQFQGEHFEDKVMAILGRFGIEPRYLELEVTESLLMKTPELTASLLQSLRQKKVRVAIDDFGTGYSSLSYLHRFPSDTLKIDQSFVRQINTPEGVSMVKTIINIGRELGMQIVAEGVETEEEGTILESMGCAMAQGYYFSRPLTPEKMASLLKHSL